MGRRLLSEDDTAWTPYYKTRAVHFDRPDSEAVIAEVNGVPTWLQFAADDSPIYQTVYERRARTEPGRGAHRGRRLGQRRVGRGRRGAKRIDAVEIDAHLLDLGKENHPDQPYDSDTVFTHIQDGRAFLEQTDRKWDLILFALPDSLTLTPGPVGDLRLESFLFTEEAAKAARDHLRPGGVFAMYNYYREDWLRDRFAGTLADTFGADAVRLDRAGEPAQRDHREQRPDAVDCPAEEQWARP